MTFVVPYTLETETPKWRGFTCPHLGCSLVYVYAGASEGYYRIEQSGELTRYFAKSG
jgi:hypothetical protein